MNTIAKVAAAGALLLLAACNKDHDPDADPTLAISPVTSSITFGADPTESYTFKVTTNQPVWLAYSDQEWCKVVMDPQTMSFTVTALPNEQPTPPPTATITVSAGKAGELTITATQAAADPEAGPTLTITPASESIAFGAEPTESYTFTVTTNQPEWAVRSDRDWCKVAADAHAGTFTVTALPNAQATPPAPATITVSAGKAAPLTISATQAAVEYDLYLTGTYWGDNNLQKVCYWKNGVLTDLSDGSSYGESGPTVASQGSLYVAGFDKGVCYWKDGERFEATGLTESAQSIAVENGSVYLLVSGHYWRDGTMVELTSSEFTGKAIAVLNGTVHIAGQVYLSVFGYTVNLAYMWRDGRAEPLKVPVSSNFSDATCVTVSGGSVYAGGWYMDGRDIQYPCYWKDNTCTTLALPQGVAPGLAAVEAICVEEGKVHAAGWYRDTEDRLCYWSDGKCTELELPADARYGRIAGIAAAAGKVYVAGGYDGLDGTCTGYWVNGKWNDMQTEAGDTRIEGIALVKR